MKEKDPDYEAIRDLIEADKEFKEGKSIVFKSLKELDKSLDEKIKKNN